jgi:hypothetical protein
MAIGRSPFFRLCRTVVRHEKEALFFIFFSRTGKRSCYTPPPAPPTFILPSDDLCCSYSCSRESATSTAHLSRVRVRVGGRVCATSSAHLSRVRVRVGSRVCATSSAHLSNATGTPPRQRVASSLYHTDTPDSSTCVGLGLGQQERM